MKYKKNDHLLHEQFESFRPRRYTRRRSCSCDVLSLARSASTQVALCSDWLWFFLCTLVLFSWATEGGGARTPSCEAVSPARAERRRCESRDDPALVQVLPVCSALRVGPARFFLSWFTGLKLKLQPQHFAAGRRASRGHVRHRSRFLMEAPSCREQPLGPEEDPAVVVGLSLCDSAPLVWRMEDLRTIRCRGLVGALLGSLPRAPRQNVRLGRPLLLLPEEERLLREHHAAAALPQPECSQAVSMSGLLKDGGRAELCQQYEEQQQMSFEEQSVLALEDRKSALLRAMTSSHIGAESGAGTADEALQHRLRALDQNFTFPRSALAVQLSTARAGLSYCSEARALLRADWPIRQRCKPRCDARYQVYRDLRGRGFYLTSAGKFGGDFLVYPGDPLRFHAHFIAVCATLDESICLLDVLAVTRLGSNVKKTVLLCSPGADGAVCYTSLQWSGMV